MKKQEISNALKAALEDKGKRKFTQSVELIVNFKGVDFNKPDKRVNVEVILPKGKGKADKIAVFADGQLALDAKNQGADMVISGDEIPKLAENKAKLKGMLNEYSFLAAPDLMMQVGKSMGQILGTRDKLPKPIIGGKVSELAERAKRTVRLKNKGKYLPVLQCLVGNENMPAEDITENIEAVYEALKVKVGEHAIKSAYVKLTMGKPHKIV